jgi:flagellar FliL protein
MAEEEQKKPRPILKLALLGLVLALVAAIGGVVLALGPAGALALVTGKPAEEAVADAPEAKPETPPLLVEEEKGEKVVEIMALDQMIVNITSVTATGRETTRFLKLNMAIAYDPKLPGAKRLGERELVLRDTIQDFLRQLHEDDLSGSAGIALLKAEILRRTRAVADGEAPREILLSDLVVQ